MLDDETKQIVNLIVYVVELSVLWGVVLCSGVYNCRKVNNLQGVKEKQEFYFGKVRHNNLFMDKSFVFDRISRIFTWMPILLIIALFCYIIAAPEYGLRVLWAGTGEFVDNLPAEMLAGISVVAIITALAGFNKKAWMGFDIYDILKEFSVIQNIRSILLLTAFCWGTIFVAPILLNIMGYQAYFAVRSLIVLDFIIYFYYLIRIVKIVVEILFERNIDRFCVNNLYRFLGVKKEKIFNKEYKTEEIEDIMEYLLDKYRKAIKKIKSKNLFAITYDTNINPTGERFKNKRTKASFSISGAMLVFTFFMTIALFPNLNEWNFQWVLLIISFFLFFCLGNFNYGYGELFVSICYGWVSYRFDYKKKMIYCREKEVFKNKKYYKLIQSIENILALYSISLEQKDTERVIIKYCYNEKSNLGKDDIDGQEQIQLLLIAMEYMYYCKKKKLIKEVDFSENDRCIQLAKGFAIKATNSIKGDHIDEERFENYLKFKQKNETNKQKVNPKKQNKLDKKDDSKKKKVNRRDVNNKSHSTNKKRSATKYKKHEKRSP